MAEPSVVDTNVILRYLLGDHREHSEEARLFFDAVREGEISAFVSEAVWAECFYLLTNTYGIARLEVLERLEGLSSFGGMTGEHRQVVSRAFSCLRQHNIAFVDALSLARAEQQGWDLMTFDQKLKRLFTMSGGDEN